MPRNNTKKNSVTTLKLSLDGENRRVGVNTECFTYQDLVKKTKTLYPSVVNSISFLWVDDENDKVVIDSDEELSEALRVMVKEHSKGYLRFEVLNSCHYSALKRFLPSDTAVHEGILCNNCGVSPITGVRFKCTFRDNFNLCEHCEILTSPQPHPMLKIRHPDQEPTGWKVSLAEMNNWFHGAKESRICDSCCSRKTSGPRFRCTLRNGYEICASCEQKSPSHFAMVKIYPSCTTKVGEKELPSASCHFRYGKDREHVSHGSGCAKVVPQQHKWRRNCRRGNGRHCWDRDSIVQAATKRTKTAPDEKAKVSRETGIQKPKAAMSSPPTATLNQRSGGHHCWDRESVKQAAKIREERKQKFDGADCERISAASCQNTDLSTSEKLLPGRIDVMPCLRSGKGRQDWNRISSKMLAAELASKRDLIAKLATEKSENSNENFPILESLAVEPSSVARSTETSSSSRKINGRHCWDRESVKQAALVRAQRKQKCEGSANENYSVAGNEKSGVTATPLPGRINIVPRLQQDVECIDKCVAPHTDFKGKNMNVKKGGMTWEITDKTDNTVVTMNENVLTLAPSVLNSQNNSKLEVDCSAPLQNSDLPRKHEEVELWANELRILNEMGFDDVEGLLPLLKTHVKTPASEQSYRPDITISAEGLQSVILEHLTHIGID